MPAVLQMIDGLFTQSHVNSSIANSPTIIKTKLGLSEVADIGMPPVRNITEDFDMLDAARKLKARWASGEVTYGAWMAIGSAMVAEAMGHAGYDWVYIDTEHTAIDLGALQQMLMALAQSDTVSIVRIPSGDPIMIKRVLDIGAAGILVPNVKSEAEALAVVSAAKYPPTGSRGFGPWRASGYFTDGGNYARGANDATIVIIQIEDVAVMDTIDAVLGVPGLDAVCTGPGDFSGTVGRFGDPGHPDVLAHLDRLYAAARRAKLPIGHGLVVSTDTHDRLVAQGHQILPITSDVAQLCHESSAKLKLFRARHGAAACNSDSMVPPVRQGYA